MLITSLLLQIALAAEPVHQTLAVQYNVWDVTAQDLNDDGKLDLIAFYGERDGTEDRKGFYVFLAKSSGSYPTKLSFDFPLDRKTGNAFFTNRDGRRQLVLDTGDGATQYVYKDNTFVETNRYTFTTLLPGRTREPIFLRNVSVDLDGDESDEWILPVIDGFEIWDAAGKRAILDVDLYGEAYPFGGLFIDHRIPTIQIFDKPGDRNKAIGIVNKYGAVFFYGDDWRSSHRHELSHASADQWDTQTAMADINHDGYPDLMVTNTKGTANIEVNTKLYFASPALKYPSKPSTQLNLKGGLAIPILVDLNGDKKLDMVVRSFPITLGNIANYLFRKKISMRLDTYTFKNGVYSTKPSYSSRVTADISEGREEIAQSYGDFDGDGKKDIAVGARSSSLTIFTHSKSGAISSRPWKTIKVHTFGIARTADLDKSGTDDIIIYHPRGKYQKNIEVIRF